MTIQLTSGLYRVGTALLSRWRNNPHGTFVPHDIVHDAKYSTGNFHKQCRLAGIYALTGQRTKTGKRFCQFDQKSDWWKQLLAKTTGMRRQEFDVTFIQMVVGAIRKQNRIADARRRSAVHKVAPRVIEYELVDRKRKRRPLSRHELTVVDVIDIQSRQKWFCHADVALKSRPKYRRKRGYSEGMINHLCLQWRVAGLLQLQIRERGAFYYQKTPKWQRQAAIAVIISQKAVRKAKAQLKPVQTSPAPVTKLHPGYVSEMRVALAEADAIQARRGSVDEELLCYLRMIALSQLEQAEIHGGFKRGQVKP